MFGNDPLDLTRTLAEMERYSREKSNFNQIEAREKFKEFLLQDLRFADFNHDALISRVQECRSCGASLDLDDPKLRGLPPRPLDRRYG